LQYYLPLINFSCANTINTEEKSHDAKEFVSETDVHAALEAGQKIYVDNKTIMTPSAREIGKANNVFVWIGESDES